MSEEQNKQAVAAQPDVEATPSTEDNSAPDEPGLDELLSQFNEATASQPDPTPVTTDTNSESEVLAELKQWRQERDAEKFQTDLNKAVERVRGDLDPDVFDDLFVESYLDAQAKRNEKFAGLWANRHQNPRQFEAALDAAKRDLAKKAAKLPDAQATEDKEAVTAAVTGATDKAPEAPAPDLSGMSDAELREFTKKEYGFTPQI